MARSRTVRRGGFGGFYAIVVVIVVIGTALVLFSRRANDAGAIGPYVAGDSTPHSKADEHWHAAIGVNICGTWQPNPNWPSTTDSGGFARKGTNIATGLHTHSDGLMHLEPASADEAGKNATVGRWMEYAGWKAGDSSLSLWIGTGGKPIDYKDGDVCPSGPYQGKKGTVFWALGRNAAGTTATKLVVQSGKSLSRYKLFDQDVIGIYFLPSGTKLTGALATVPSESKLSDPTATESAGSTTTAKPGSTTTTKPGSTTTKPGSTTTTSKAATPTTTAGSTTAATTVP